MIDSAFISLDLVLATVLIPDSGLVLGWDPTQSIGTDHTAPETRTAAFGSGYMQ